MRSPFKCQISKLHYSIWKTNVLFLVCARSFSYVLPCGTPSLGFNRATEGGWGLREGRKVEDHITVVQRERESSSCDTRLKADLQKETEETGWREDRTGSLHHCLSALEKRCDAAMVSCREVKEECEKAKVEIKKRDHLSLSEPPHSEGGNYEDESLCLWEDGLPQTSMKERWQTDVSQLRERLGPAEQHTVSFS